MPELAAGSSERNVVIAAIAVFFLSLAGAFLAEEPLLCLAPLAFLLAYQLLINYKPVFFLLLLSTPLSLEFYFDSGLSTDLPTEPLEVILMFTFIFYVLLRKENISKEFLNHPITIILGVHFIWMIIATIFSQDIAISLKYMLAKTWYITVFYFLASQVIKEPANFRAAFWCLFVPTLFVVLYTLNNHYKYNFAFSEVNKTMYPYFRNHVNYAVFLALVLPFVMLARTWYSKYTWQKILLNLGVVLLIIAIYLSYTRSAWLSVIAAVICYFLIQRNMLRQAVIAAVAGVLIFIALMFHDNKFLQYAPDYKKTIYHGNFSDHMESTMTLEDVSSAERIYRWIAASNMIKERPLIGFGPEQFYSNYKEYTVNKFVTYISRNDEHSTVHNYYLEVTVEQGLPGLVIWLSFLVTILFCGQTLYLKAKEKQDKFFIMAVILSFITILVNIALSDLIEADKIGTLFFLNIAMLVNMSIYLRKKESQVN